ncbi:ATP-dependent DNA helicase UvrD2 [Actinobacteria bacterium YIM 96077]|uniref:DNA 3'-5' helicase n=1 Tax=Phytoactinopolyspora halophila TaxID=1981511 RepID=A0A329R2K6_9ACTN|nr:ATP-dependent DNA helicase UvrD2 [Phytoactinopolyspora halophila]AYY11956.1 ATP-dependent DNA helicase UvrD2 [Actinobacteria bacterium YIM 96077]RAW18810.1 ATP-dependent DNA helicase [Phytoactinopolyspora halophila]
MAVPDVLSDLDPEQREVAAAVSGPVCVIAGAGTGKTRAITHRIAYGVHVGAFDPRRVLAVTFTTRAAGEMRGRLRSLGVDGVQARTFHSAALRQARYFWPQVTGGDLPEIMESKLNLVGTAASRCRVGTDRAVLRDLASEIEWAKVSNVLAEQYSSVAETSHREVAGVDAPTVARVYAAYEDLKFDRGLMDMEDILLAAVGLLEANPGVAEAVRAQYHHFVVDEYQDVSPLQQRLLELWLGERDDVCVVGDPAQTIYSFAGARPDYLLGFTERYPSATTIRLFRDYRSTPQVVSVANGVLRSASEQRENPEQRTGVVLQAQRPAGPEAVFVEHADEVAEAEWVAAEIARLRASGVPAREIAILFRVNAQSENYEQALANADIPYAVRGAERFFERAEVRQAAMLLRGAVRAGESPGDAPDAAAATAAILTSAGWSERPPSSGGAARERWESLAAVVALAEDVVAAQPDAGLADVVAELDARAASQHAPVADGVTVASLHAAKGLEWDAVFVVGVHEGTLPLNYAETAEQIEEERRLLYVGVTRAREHLSISWSLARQPGGRGTRQASRFLDGVRPGAAARTGSSSRERVSRPAAKRARSPARCRGCAAPLVDAAARKLGRCGDCPSTLDEALYERLREWRLERSREQKVPAYVVFTDATLMVIAETKPTEERALAELPGVGRAKLDRYGAEVLALCREHAVSNN